MFSQLFGIEIAVLGCTSLAMTYAHFADPQLLIAIVF